MGVFEEALQTLDTHIVVVLTDSCCGSSKNTYLVISSLQKQSLKVCSTQQYTEHLKQGQNVPMLC